MNWFLVLAAVALLVLCVVIGARAVGLPRSPERARCVDTDPLTQFERERTAGRVARRAECDNLLRRLDSDRWTRVDTPSTASGPTVLAWDLWDGNDFQSRPVGSSSWFSRKDGPADESISSRLEHCYALSDDDKSALRRMQNSTIGQLPWIAAQIASRIRTREAWQLDVFDTPTGRIDPVEELTAITERARNLHDQQKQLGLAPAGPLRDSADVVETYIRKASLLDQGTARLLERVSAFADYSAAVDRLETLYQRNNYIAALETVDDLDQAVAAELDRHCTERLKSSAQESGHVVDVTLDPIPRSLSLGNYSPFPSSLVTTPASERNR